MQVIQKPKCLSEDCPDLMWKGGGKSKVGLGEVERKGCTGIRDSEIE